MAQVARGSLDNAVDLLSDARLLLASGRWPRAYALAVLAGEEYGKFQMTVSMAATSSDETVAWQKYWERFQRHDPKLTTWRGQHVDLKDWGPLGSPGDTEWLRAWDGRSEQAKVTQGKKLSALYVDFRQGRVSLPRSAVSGDDARHLVAAVAEVIDWASQSFPGDLSRLVTPPPELVNIFSRMSKARTAEERREVGEEMLGWLTERFSRGATAPATPVDTGRHDEQAADLGK